MLSTLKNKVTNIPDSIYKIVNTPQKDPDSEPSKNNIVEIKCVDQQDVLLGEVTLTSPNGKFTGTMIPKRSGKCAYIHVNIFWTPTQRWYPQTQPAVGGDWWLSTLHFCSGKSLSVTLNVTGDG